MTKIYCTQCDTKKPEDKVKRVVVLASEHMPNGVLPLTAHLCENCRKNIDVEWIPYSKYEKKKDKGLVWNVKDEEWREENG